MEKEFELLKIKFFEIKKQGWIKSSRKGPTGIGKTFEDLIEKKEDDFSIPDYYGIEIKTKRFNTREPYTLFCAEPDGKGFLEAERIRLTYGYPSKNYPQFQVFNATIKANKWTKIGDNYFSLKLNKNNVFLIVKNSQNKVIDTKTCWSFEMLGEIINRKLNFLAIIKAYSKYEDCYEYFKYSQMIYCQNISFDKFITLMKEGKIVINFKIGVFTGDYRYGQVHNRGTGFSIYENYIAELYENCCVIGEGLGKRA